MSSFWLNDPMALLRKEHIKEIWPKEKMSTNLKLNAVTRLVLLLSILGYVFGQNIRFLWVGCLTIGGLVAFYMFSEKKLLKEGLESSVSVVEAERTATVPTTTNPLMNILMTEYKDRPLRNKALMNNDSTASLINDKVKSRVISKVGDARIFRGIDNELELENSMRNFYTTPNTTIPNDQKGFSEFLYGDMISGKEGNEAALVRHNARLGQVNV